MSKRQLAGTAMAFIVALLPCVALGETLVIYNWAEYLSKKTITKFEAQTGHVVREVFYDNEGERDRVILSNDKLGYDLVIFDEHSLDIFSESDLLQDISQLNISGKQNQGHHFRNECGAAGIPYGWGTTGIAYRSSIIQQDINSWHGLFTPPEEAKGGIIMPLDGVDTTSILLLTLGKDTDTADVESLEASLDLLKSQMPYLIDYGYGLTHAELLGSQSKMVMTMAYSSDIKALEELTGQTDWKYVVPEEGSTLWVDCWAIPRGKQVSQAAIDFLSFMNDPENASENAEEASFTTTNTAARQFLSDEYLTNPILNPDSKVLDRSQPTPGLSAEALRLRNWLVFSAKSNFDEFQKQQ